MGGVLRQTPDGLKKTIAGSLVFHIIVISLGLLLLGSRASRTIFTPVYSVSLVAGAKARRPAPAVKRRTKAPRPKAHKRRKTRTHKAAPPGAAQDKTVKIRKKTAPGKEKVSVDAAIKRLREKVRAKEASEVAASIEAIEERAADPGKVSVEIERIRAAIAGREASRTAAARTGGGLSQESLAVKYRAYYNAVTERVQSHWVYPALPGSEKMLVMVGLRIGRDGRLINVRVEKGSGNARFDASLINAVRKAAPFPPLPADYAQDALDIGFRFCPGCGTGTPR